MSDPRALGFPLARWWSSMLADADLLAAPARDVHDCRQVSPASDVKASGPSVRTGAVTTVVASSEGLECSQRLALRR
jgi:hypothetical protein